MHKILGILTNKHTVVNIPFSYFIQGDFNSEKTELRLYIIIHNYI